jgi:hypothetical protein
MITMTYGNTKKYFFIQIAIIETVYMPQKVLFGPILDPFEAGT